MRIHPRRCSRHLGEALAVEVMVMRLPHFALLLLLLLLLPLLYSELTTKRKYTMEQYTKDTQRTNQKWIKRQKDKHRNMGNGLDKSYLSENYLAIGILKRIF